MTVSLRNHLSGKHHKLRLLSATKIMKTAVDNPVLKMLVTRMFLTQTAHSA